MVSATPNVQNGSRWLGEVVHEVLVEHVGADPSLHRLESGGATPTVPLLARWAAALDAELDITLRPHVA